MIITKKKEFKDIVDVVGKGPVFIAGCSECATICHTGGEEEILEMKNALIDKKIEVTGSILLEPACHLLNDKRLFRQHKKELERANKILVLACGNGVQTVSEISKDWDVISGTDTLFLGEIKRANDFEKRCQMCGECFVDTFEGLCPVSRCPKSMLNGPCGGSKNGKCEVDSELDCIWILIYNSLKEKDELHRLNELRDCKDWSKSLKMRRTL